MPANTETLPKSEIELASNAKRKFNPKKNGLLLFYTEGAITKVFMEYAMSYIPAETDRRKFPQRDRTDLTLPMRETAYDMALNAFGLVPQQVEFYNSLPDPIIEDIPAGFREDRAPQTYTYWSALRCMEPFPGLCREGRDWYLVEEALSHVQDFKREPHLKVLTMLPPGLFLPDRTDH